MEVEEEEEEQDDEEAAVVSEDRFVRERRNLLRRAHFSEIQTLRVEEEATLVENDLVITTPNGTSSSSGGAANGASSSSSSSNDDYNGAAAADDLRRGSLWVEDEIFVHRSGSGSLTSHETFHESDEDDPGKRLNAAVATAALALPAPLAAATLSARLWVKRALASSCAEAVRLRLEELREYDIAGCVTDASKAVYSRTIGVLVVRNTFLAKMDSINCD